jgi:hypothetical protein
MEKTALKLIDTETFDVIFMDQHMAYKKQLPEPRPRESSEPRELPPRFSISANDVEGLFISWCRLLSFAIMSKGGLAARTCPGFIHQVHGASCFKLAEYTLEVSLLRPYFGNRLIISNIYLSSCV